MSTQVIDIGRPPATSNINLGQLCSGDTVDIKVCNSSSAITYSIISCTCPNFAGLPARKAFGACACVTYTLTYTGLGYPNDGHCVIYFTNPDGQTTAVNLTWQEVYCEISTTAWTLTDSDGASDISNSTFNADCEVWNRSCMASRHTFTITRTLVQPLVAGDVVYFSQWLFAQIVDWNYGNYPIAGWKYRICTVGGEEPTVDGTYQMEWYGESPSEENSATTPYVTIAISGGGTSFAITINFNLTQDQLSFNQNATIFNHNNLLANSVRGQELQNDFENSVYRNPKFMSWATTIYRTIGAVYQDSIFSIKALLPFYNEGALPVLFSINSLLLFTPTGQATDYLSTTRATSAIVNFNYDSGNAIGTIPDGFFVYMIRNDSFNDQLDYYENYEYEQADLLNLVASARITPTVAPVNIAGNEFEAEFDISTIHPELEGVNSLALSYRFIFVARSLIDTQSRSAVTEPVALINYDDEHLTLSGLQCLWRTVEQEYAPNIQTLTDLPVNMDLESTLRIDRANLNAQILAKTGGKLSDTLTAVRMKMYYKTPLNNGVDLNVLYFDPNGKMECGGMTNDGFVDRSQGTILDVTYPFMIPDNIYRQMGREALYQSNGEAEPLEVLQTPSLNCVANAVSNECNVGQALTPIINTNLPVYGLIYIPEINQVWASTTNQNTIECIDLNTLLVVNTITLPVGANMSALHYKQSANRVYAFADVSDACYVIDIYTNAVITTIALPAGGAFHYLTAIDSIDRLYVTDFANTSVIEINTASNSIIGVPLSIAPNQPYAIAYISSLNELWVCTQTPDEVVRINRTTMLVVGAIAMPTAARNIIQVGNEVWIACTGTIEVVDISTLAITNTVTGTSLALGFMILLNGVVYQTDGVNSVLMINTQTYAVYNTFFSGTTTNTIIATPNYLIVGNEGDDTHTPFDLECPDILPNQSFQNKSIINRWELEFKYFDNTETYYIHQEISKPQGSKLNIGDFFDDIDVVPYEPDGTIGTTPVTIFDPCDRRFQVTANVNPVYGSLRVYGVAIEIQPVRSGVISSRSSDPAVNPILIPIDSPFIQNLTPAFGLTTSIQFDLDIRELPYDGDYELRLHYIIRP